jgi:heme/copper-type cytochrome/quinol oxidase subunit 2
MGTNKMKSAKHSSHNQSSMINVIMFVVLALVIVFVAWFWLSVRHNEISYNDIKRVLDHSAQHEGLLYGAWVASPYGLVGSMITTLVFTENDVLAPGTGKYLVTNNSSASITSTTFSLISYVTDLTGSLPLLTVTDTSVSPAVVSKYNYSLSQGGTVLTYNTIAIPASGSVPAVAAGTPIVLYRVL